MPRPAGRCLCGCRHRDSRNSGPNSSFHKHFLNAGHASGCPQTGARAGAKRSFLGPFLAVGAAQGCQEPGCAVPCLEIQLPRP